MNVIEMANENLKKFGEYTQLTISDKNYTNFQIYKMANQLATYLKRKSLVEDDRVLVMLPNIPEVMISYQAILTLGAVIVPVNNALRAEEVDYVLHHSEPTIVITNKEGATKVNQIIHPHVKVVLVVDSNEMTDIYNEKVTMIETIPKYKNDVAAIIYTSGTTGFPKGAMITHGNIYSIHMELQALGVLSKDYEPLVKVGCPILVVLPISHIYGLTVSMMSYLIGARIVLMERFDAEVLFYLMKKEKIKIFSGVPTIYYHMALYAQSVEVDVSSVEYWISGAAPLSKEIRYLFENQFNTKILEGYGLTETTSSFALQHADAIKINSVGKPFPESEVAVFDEGYNKLGRKAIGELGIKGPNVMKGYYKMAEETDSVLRDGWMMTGDIGYIDEDNDIFIIDRKKDVIIHGGFNIYPMEIENALLNHPAISQAGVIGKKDDVMGEVVVAFIALNKDSSVTEEAVIAYCREKLATYKVPEKVTILPELPINELGKVVRKELRMQYEED